MTIQEVLDATALNGVSLATQSHYGDTYAMIWDQGGSRWIGKEEYAVETLLDLPLRKALDYDDAWQSLGEDELPEADKENATNWETYSTFGSLWEGGGCDVEVQIGDYDVFGETYYILRTKDDADGSDDADNKVYAKIDDAKKAAQALID